jgi:hypothetical protein
LTGPRTRTLSPNGLDSKNGAASAALASAIETGHEQIALLLIKARAPVHLSDTDDWSKPLFRASHWRRFKILEALVKAGADVNQKDSRRATWLASYGYFDPYVGKILLDAVPTQTEETITAQPHSRMLPTMAKKRR